MALTHVLLTDLLGASAVNDAVAHPNTTITFKPAECGNAGNVTDSDALTPEGIMLAVLQRWHSNQGASSTRCLEITRSTPVITSRGGSNVRGERYIVTIYAGASIDVLDPDDII